MSVKIKSLHILAFGKFYNTQIDFADGFNLINGKNEAGKSTIVSFIEGILYGFDEGVRVHRFNKKHEIYRPVNSYKYAGYAIFTKDCVDYRVSRDFFDGAYEIYDLSLGKVVESQPSNLNYPGEFLLEIDYEIYKDLISTYQMQESSAKAKTKITELLNINDDYNFSSNESLNFLDNMLSDIGSERAYTKPFAKTKLEIDELSSQILELKSLRSTYNKDFIKLDKIRTDVGQKSEELRNLRGTRDSYRQNVAYQNLEEEIKYKNELNRINSELAGLKEYENFEIKEEIPKLKNKSLYINLIISATLIIIWFITKLNYLLALAIILPVIISMIDRLDSDKNESSETRKIDNNYIRYEKLLAEKSKVVEILRVLENQDKTIDRSNIEEIQSIDIREIEKKIAGLEVTLEKLNKDQIDLEKNLASVEDKLSTEVDLVDRLNTLEDRLIELESEIEAINLAKSYIIEIEEAKSTDKTRFSKEVSEIIRAISKDKYQDITYDKDLIPRILTYEGNFMDLDKLSTSFYDQLNFALKFSINEDINNDFLIFDDAFINYDLERLRTALFFLLDIATNRQIIYLTCHTRETDVLLSEDIDINIINLEEI